MKRTKEEVIQIIHEAREKNEWADLSGSDLQEMDLRDTGISRDDLTGANLRGANLLRMDLSVAKLEGADLRNANLRWTNFRALDIGLFFPANLSKSNLSEAILIFANLSKANLADAVLSKANISGANLSEADLTRVDLSEANIRKADLRKTNLNGANLRQADLREANLTGVNLEDANLSDAHTGYTIFGDVDLSVAKGLDTVQHMGPSIISIETIYRSNDSASCKSFLEKAGVPPYLLEYVEKTKAPRECLYTPEQINNWINESKKLLIIYQKSIFIVRERMALKGAFKEVQDSHELEHYEKMIEEINFEISEYSRHQQKGCPVCAGK